MGTIKRRLILFIMQSWIYTWLMKNIIWRIRFTTYYTDFTGVKYKKGYKVLKHGDICLSTDKLKLTSFLIPGGIVDHAALCIAKSDTSCVKEIAEMTHDNYKEIDFFDFCKESTRVIIMRCKSWDAEYIKAVIRNCRSFKNAKYDLEFSLGIRSLYCSELIYHADFMQKMRVDLSDFAGIGRRYISPMGLLYSVDNYCVYDSENVLSGLTGEQIERLCA